MRKKHKEYIKGLLEFYKIDKCKNCNCLQDELKRLFNKIKDNELNSKLKQHIVSKTHPCLGCKPCKPALLIGKFMQRKL